MVAVVAGSDTGVGDVREIAVTMEWYNWNSTTTTGEVSVSVSDGQTGTSVVSGCFPYALTSDTCRLGSAKTTLSGDLFLGTKTIDGGGGSVEFCPPGVSPR